ncbi:MAG: sulfotransferase [Deltaproteobacteria bacterium]|nr:sulfotransferase [Deltaproteobacteria bacterium]
MAIKNGFNGPLFVVGMPRSGTKLFRAILNQHSCIKMTDAETEFLPYWAKNWGRFGDLSSKENFKKFYNMVVKLPYFKYMRDRGRIIKLDDWHHRCQTYDVAGVFETLVKHDTGVKDDTVIWGDKSPSYLRHLTLLKTLYPDTKFIHIIRDVRDYCLSINKTWSKNMIRATQRWTDDIRKCRSDANGLDDDYLEVLYEDLLTNTETVVKRTCEFLGVGFEQQMLQLDKPTEYIGSAKGYIGIYSNNIRKYRSKMDRDLRIKIESIAADLLRDLSYEIEYDKDPVRVSQSVMRLYQIADGINTLKFYYKERGLLQGMFFWWRLFLGSGDRI